MKRDFYFNRVQSLWYFLIFSFQIADSQCFDVKVGTINFLTIKYSLCMLSRALELYDFDLAEMIHSHID